MAHAQSGQTTKTEGGDKWILTQQAFARFDYTSAFKYATETLAANPQNWSPKSLNCEIATTEGWTFGVI